MKRKERNQTHKRQSSRTRRREAESPIRDLPEEAWDIDQRPSEGALISFSAMESFLDLFPQPVPRIRDVSFVGTKEREGALQAGSFKKLGCPYPRPLSVFLLLKEKELLYKLIAIYNIKAMVSVSV